MARRLLIAYAHPDDESFGSGGMIAHYVAQGVEVTYVCATNGDVGTVKPELLNGYGSVAELRQAELACAAEILGFKQVIKLNYKDSGMMGSETSSDPTCLWQAPQDEVTRRMVEIIREIKPQVVVTFNKYGGYGHPDHIAIQRATVTAFSLAGDASYKTDQEPYAPQKLYYSSIPRRQLQIAVALTHFRGQDPRRLGRNRDINLVAILDNAEPIHTTINVKPYQTIWDAASACHASQLGGGASRLPLWMRRFIAPMQNYTRVYPAPPRRRVDEHDLFHNVMDEPAGAAAR
jgi:N-acetyl-1-D-myo-inositol-2-amino-2-deoxy-alpha-D-glucopyranoside deacetylase